VEALAAVEKARERPAWFLAFRASIGAAGLPESPETFVGFHLGRGTRTIGPADLAPERAARPGALAGRIAVVHESAWAELDATAVEVLVRGDVFSLARIR
jgi:hypothetical protein